MKEEIKEEKPVPEGVVNKEAYKELLLREKELRESPDRFYEAKTAEYTFDFWTAYVFLLKQITISKVADYEADIIKTKAKAFIGRKGQLQRYRWAAFKGGGSKYENIHSILDHYKAQLICLFGRFYTNEEVHKIATTQWNLDVAFTTIERFRRNHLDLIQVEQDKYVRDWSGLKLVYKKSRLDEYSYLYEDRKIKYEETKHRDDYRLLLQTLDAIRKEIEGDRLTVDGGLEVSIQQTIDIHIQQDLMKNLNILQFIIARVSARLGLDQSFLMGRLEKSFYAKFTGIVQPDTSNDEIYYPSRELYDFNRIKIENAKIIEEHKNLNENLPVLKEESKDVSNALLNALLKRKKVIVESEKRSDIDVSATKEGLIKPKFKAGSLKKRNMNSNNRIQNNKKKKL